MQINTRDETLKKNYIQKYCYFIEEYELVKKGGHPRFTRVGDFYKAHGTCAQTFLKYYGRYRQSGSDVSQLPPGKRGPKYKSRRTDPAIEAMVLQERDRGCNKYEINSILRSQLGDRTPSPSCIYNILKRHGKNKLTLPMKEEKRRIIKEKAGELGHIDCHYLAKDMIASDSKRYYVVCLIDRCTRVAWAEVVEDIKSISVMFATLHCLNQMISRYDITFEL